MKKLRKFDLIVLTGVLVLIILMIINARQKGINMIKNWKQHSLYMNFKKCDVGNGQPSDIDMVYLSKHGDLVIGEIKNETAFIRRTLNKAQFKRLKGIADKYINNALIIYISHNKSISNVCRKRKTILYHRTNRRCFI